jgi:chemotaxis protein methyltransferase CheR
MKAFEHFKTNTKVKILATDVNTEVLNIAKTGIYNKNSIERNIKFNEISSFFDFIDNETVKVNDKIKSMITFKQLNFLESKYPIKEKLDLIFFRNVMIYFDKETREKIINKFADYLCEDGLLIIGHSENISFLTERFELLDTTTYRKVK